MPNRLVVIEQPHVGLLARLLGHKPISAADDKEIRAAFEKIGMECVVLPPGCSMVSAIERDDEPPDDDDDDDDDD